LIILGRTKLYPVQLWQLSKALGFSYSAYLHELITIYSCESLPYRLDTINEGLQHEHIVDGLLSMLIVNLGCEYNELVE
jgi:hypothetical protein